MPPAPVLLRNSERTTYRRCRHRWAWKYLDRLDSTGTKGALAFGTLVHAALEEHYRPGVKRGPHPAHTFAELFDAAGEEFGQWDEDGSRHDARELGVAMLEHYVEFWGDDSHLEVYTPEYPFEIPILTPKGKYLVTMVGKFDLVFRDHRDGQLWLSDHKTAKSIKTDYLQLDDQAGTYLLVANDVLRAEGVLGKKERIAGVLYNFLRKAKPDPRPQDDHGRYLNKDGSVSKVQPPDHFLRHKVYRSRADDKSELKRVRAEAYEMNLVREGRLPIYKNPTKDCSWDCDFFEMCILHETGGDWEELRDLTMKTWDPYEDHVDEHGVVS